MKYHRLRKFARTFVVFAMGVVFVCSQIQSALGVTNLNTPDRQRNFFGNYMSVVLPTGGEQYVEVTIQNNWGLSPPRERSWVKEKEAKNTYVKSIDDFKLYMQTHVNEVAVLSRDICISKYKKIHPKIDCNKIYNWTKLLHDYPKLNDPKVLEGIYSLYSVELKKPPAFDLNDPKTYQLDAAAKRARKDYRKKKANLAYYRDMLNSSEFQIKEGYFKEIKNLGLATDQEIKIFTEIEDMADKFSRYFNTKVSFEEFRRHLTPTSEWLNDSPFLKQIALSYEKNRPSVYELIHDVTYVNQPIIKARMINVKDIITKAKTITRINSHALDKTKCGILATLRNSVLIDDNKKYIRFSLLEPLPKGH